MTIAPCTMLVIVMFEYKRFCAIPPAPGDLAALSDFMRMPYSVPLNEQLVTVKFDTPPAVLLPIDTPCPTPNTQLVTRMSVDIE